MKIRFLVFAATLLFAASLFATSGFAGKAALELIMFHSPDCEWCETWDEEIGEGYDKTSESRQAPLRRVDVDDQKTVKGLERPIAYTPTFVLMSGGREVGRITGHPGVDFFYPLLAELIAKAQQPAS